MRSKKNDQPYVFALADCALRGPGDKYSTNIEAGKAYWADWPLVLANPTSFSPDPTVIFPRNWASPAAVEQATSAPGELRETGRG